MTLLDGNVDPLLQPLNVPIGRAFGATHRSPVTSRLNKHATGLSESRQTLIFPASCTRKQKVMDARLRCGDLIVLPLKRLRYTPLFAYSLPSSNRDGKIDTIETSTEPVLRKPSVLDSCSVERIAMKDNVRSSWDPDVAGVIPLASDATAHRANIEAIDAIVSNDRFPYIVAWGKWLGFTPKKVRSALEKAAADGAPNDVIQFVDGCWMRITDIVNETNRRRVKDLVVRKRGAS